LEALLARQLDHDAGIVRIVLDDEQDRVARLDLQPVVGDLLKRSLRQPDRMGCGRMRRRRVRCWARSRRRRRADIFERQIEREARAYARRTAQVDLAAEQVRQLATDRKPETGATILTAGAGVRLHEGLEDHLLLLERDADAGIRHLEG